MYRRDTSVPPGYGGTAFDNRPAWPPREEPPREPRRPLPEQPGFAPFAAGKRTVEEAEPAPSKSEKPHEEKQAQPQSCASREQRLLSEDTLLLFGILLLVLQGEETADLLPILSILLFL